MFSAIVIDKTASGTEAHLRQIDETQLSAGDVLVEVDCSTLNYKDGLALTGRGPIIKSFPMVPGVDFAGTVVDSQHPGHRPGDKVLLNGWGVGESHTGGLSQRARVKGEWLMPLPEAFTPAQAMAIGTAGYTAMLSIMALERSRHRAGRRRHRGDRRGGRGRQHRRQPSRKARLSRPGQHRPAAGGRLPPRTSGPRRSSTGRR